MVTWQNPGVREYAAGRRRRDDVVGLPRVDRERDRARALGGYVGVDDVAQNDALGVGDLLVKGAQLALLGIGPKGPTAQLQTQLGAVVRASKQDYAADPLQLLTAPFNEHSRQEALHDQPALAVRDQSKMAEALGLGIHELLEAVGHGVESGDPTQRAGLHQPGRVLEAHGRHGFEIGVAGHQATERVPHGGRRFESVDEDHAKPSVLPHQLPQLLCHAFRSVRPRY
nr:hypothetical protein [Streptomyces sp. Ag82_O1-15]